MTLQREDPVFGLLTFDPTVADSGAWGKQEQLQMIGGNISLSIQVGSGGPTQEQRQVYLTFRGSGSDTKAELQEALFEFYKSEREIYAPIYDEICDEPSQVEEFVPELTSSEGIWKLLTPDHWLILGPESWVGQEDVSGIKCDTAIFWHGCWDIEHEFGALFKDGRLIGIRGLGNF